MALADHPRIGAATKQRIREIADEYGYVANSAGRALRVRKTDVIGLVVPQTGEHVFGHPYFMSLLVGVTTAANDHETSVMVSTNTSYQHGMSAYERVLNSGAVEGAIVASAAINDPNVARLVDSPMPVVLVGHYLDHENAVTVWVDDRVASFRITEHLVRDHGLDKVGHISGPLTHQIAVDRYVGFCEACEARGNVTRVLYEGDFDEDSGYDGTCRLLADLPDIQGIVAANDEMAFGALRALRQLGRRVPEDVALVGFDDFGVSRLTTPAITTIRVPATQIGRVSAEQLFALIDGQRQANCQIILPVELIVRDSCGEHPPTGSNDRSPNDQSPVNESENER